ncbi:unnamed protein product, partial [Meganyctiphanes norvegica]
GRIASLAITDETGLWVNGIIPYTIDLVFTEHERQVIARAMEEFHARTCLRFVGRQTIQPEPDYIHIKSGTGCSSSVGRQGNKQDLSLKKDGCVYFGIVIHELMHAAGFEHEQSRNDRNNYVSINWDNIKGGKSHNFNEVQSSFACALERWDCGFPIKQNNKRYCK